MKNTVRNVTGHQNNTYSRPQSTTLNTNTSSNFPIYSPGVRRNLLLHPCPFNKPTNFSPFQEHPILAKIAGKSRSALHSHQLERFPAKSHTKSTARMRPSFLGTANLCLGLICAVGVSSTLRPAECFEWIRNRTPPERSESTEYCPAIPYQLIAKSTKNLVRVISAFQELNDLPFMLRAGEDFWEKGPFADKNSLLAFLAIEQTTMMRVIFANFNHITDVALSRLETTAVMDSNDHSAGFKMFLYCRETEHLQDYFREILPAVNACKAQIALRIQYVQVLFRQLQRIRAMVPKDAISASLEKNSTVSFQVALPWYHWRMTAEARRRERKHKLEKLLFLEVYFFRAEKKLKSIMKLLQFIEDKLLSQSAQEIEIYSDCRSIAKPGVGNDDTERKSLQSRVAYLKTELEKLGTATARWITANPNDKGYVRGFAFSLAGL